MAKRISIKNEKVTIELLYCFSIALKQLSTIEHDLEEYVKEILDDATNLSHKIEIRTDGVRAGEEITIYDSKNKTMYHTAFSRLSRKEIAAMLALVSKFDTKGKYSGMRLLPLSISDIEKALERAKTGNYKHLLFGSATPESESTERTVKQSSEGITPYGRWIKELEHGQNLHRSIKDKYMGGYDSGEERRKREEVDNERKRLEEIEREKKRKFKIQRDFEMAQKVNDERTKEYLQRQKQGQELKRLEEMDKFNQEIANLRNDLERKLEMVTKQSSALRIQTENLYTLPQLRIPKIQFHDRKYFLKRKIKRKFQNLNNSASPNYRSGYMTNKARNAKNYSINSEFKMKRIKGEKSKRVARNDEDIHNNQNENQKENQNDKIDKNGINIAVNTSNEEDRNKSQSVEAYTYSKSISPRRNAGIVSNRNSHIEYYSYMYPVNGFNQHVNRNRQIKKNINFDSVEHRPKPNSRNNKLSNYKIVENTFDVRRRKKKDDYLLQKRIEREINPDKAFKRRNWWNMSLREDYNDDDYLKMYFKAQLISHKALEKEKRILDHISDKEKVEQIKEIDKMLMNSLKAKLELINGL